MRVGWINLAEDRDKWRAVVDAVIDLRGAENAGNFSTSWGTVTLSRRTVLHGVIFFCT